PTIWDKLGEQGKRCMVINQPATYPASPINGVLISGFVAIELEKAVAPVSYLPKLRRLDYQIDIDTMRARQDHDYLFRELDRTLEARQRVVEHLWEEEWEYFQLVVTGTDRLHHFVWEGIEDESHPYHQRIVKYYQKVDRLAGKLYEKFSRLTDGEGRFFILSDHGFTGIRQEVYLNSWLRQEGYLNFRVPQPYSVEDIEEGTVAFALDPNRIYLNRKGRFPRGAVGENEAATLREEIRRKLEGLQHQGERVVEKVFPGEELYSGPWVGMGPDLVVLSRYGYDMKGSVKEKEVFGRSNLQGMHTWDNAFFFSGEKVNKEDLHITDICDMIIGFFN
ncbi:MAG: alkaline phosphatase family protein, partial [Candidatus Aminicenantes bacterium]|nr:alkaline phosphatase family protein [Candidatus Aminicenantes bacterium]